MIVGDYCDQFAREFARVVSGRPGWTSTVFTHSTLGLMEELLVAGRYSSEGVLSEGSFGDLLAQVVKRVLADPGLGPLPERGRLRNQLPRSSKQFVPSSYAYKALTELTSRAKASYIENWAHEWARADYQPGVIAGDPFDPYQAAALISAFFLDLGFNQGYLTRWIEYRIEYAPERIDLAELADQLVRLFQDARGPVDTVVAVIQAPTPDIRAFPGWMTAAEVRQWCQAEGVTPPRTLHGGLNFQSVEWDLDAALANVSANLHRLEHRARLAGQTPPRFHRNAWIKGLRRERRIPAYPLLTISMRAYVPTATSASAPQSANRLEVAVEFIQAAALTGGPAAVPMAWAALEALFSAPGDDARMDAATRAADVGVVAFVRTELGETLRKILKRTKSEEVAQRLRSVDGNDRLALFLAELESGVADTIANPKIALATRHAASLLLPDTVRTRREEFQQTFRALYRQRNLILHGGVTDAPLLHGVVRALPLVAAVVNRYARVSVESGAGPLLVAFESNQLVEAYIAGSRPLIDFMIRPR